MFHFFTDLQNPEDRPEFAEVIQELDNVICDTESTSEISEPQNQCIFTSDRQPRDLFKTNISSPEIVHQNVKSTVHQSRSTTENNSNEQKEKIQENRTEKYSIKLPEMRDENGNEHTFESPLSNKPEETKSAKDQSTVFDEEYAGRCQVFK